MREDVAEPGALGEGILRRRRSVCPRAAANQDVRKRQHPLRWLEQRLRLGRYLVRVPPFPALSRNFGARRRQRRRDWLTLKLVPVQSGNRLRRDGLALLVLHPRAAAAPPGAVLVASKRAERAEGRDDLEEVQLRQRPRVNAADENLRGRIRDSVRQDCGENPVEHVAIRTVADQRVRVRVVVLGTSKTRRAAVDANAVESENRGHVLQRRRLQKPESLIVEVEVLDHPRPRRPALVHPPSLVQRVVPRHRAGKKRPDARLQHPRELLRRDASVDVSDVHAPRRLCLVAPPHLIVQEQRVDHRGVHPPLAIGLFANGVRGVTAHGPREPEPRALRPASASEERHVRAVRGDDVTRLAVVGEGGIVVVVVGLGRVRRVLGAGKVPDLGVERGDGGEELRAGFFAGFVVVRRVLPPPPRVGRRRRRR